MADVTEDPLLVIVRHSPYSSSLARSGLDTALATAAFGQAVVLLFLGDGVLQLLPEQDSSAIEQRNVSKLLASLPLYDIESVFVDVEAANRYRLDPDQSPVPATLLDTEGIQALIDRCLPVLGF
jgi:tRNA 2-thiouridine synthesizing protein C